MLSEHAWLWKQSSFFSDSGFCNIRITILGDIQICLFNTAVKRLYLVAMNRNTEKKNQVLKSFVLTEYFPSWKKKKKEKNSGLLNIPQIHSKMSVQPWTVFLLCGTLLYSETKWSYCLSWWAQIIWENGDLCNFHALTCWWSNCFLYQNHSYRTCPSNSN